MSRRPPSPLVRLLEAALPPGPVGQSIVGDLTEEWSRRPGGPGRVAWFAAVALGLSARYGAARAGAVVAAGASELVRSARWLGRHPLQNGLTVLALGVGIAAPATMFSVVAGLVRDIEVDEPDRLVHFGRRWTPDVIGITRLEWLWPGLDGVEELAHVGYYARRAVDLSGPVGPPERRVAVAATPAVFRAFGVDAALGRTFGPGDPLRSPGPVLLGWELWRGRFGGVPSVVGSTVRVDGAPRTVIGVMPEGFRSPSGADLWLPLDPVAAAGAGDASYQAVGRLADGASFEAVRARVAALDAAARAEADEPLRPGRTIAVETWRDSQIAPRHRRMLGVMLALVSCVLLIACADVANLLLARAVGRSRETAVRVAMGAGRGRLVLEHLAGTAVLSAAAGVAALGLTVVAVRLFEARSAASLAYWMDFRVDTPVLLFGTGLVVLAAVATGLVPALQAGRVDVAPLLRDGDRGSSPFRIGRIGRGLVAGEVALSCTLLVVAGLMVRGAFANLGTDGDYATGNVLAASYDLRAHAHPTDEAVLAFHRGLVDGLRDRPGVAGVALMSHLPGVFTARRSVEIEGRTYEEPGDRPLTHVAAVSPSFLSTLGSGTLRGRGLTWEDGTRGEPVALVNEDFVRTHLGGRDPVGARIRLPSRTEDPAPWLTVVGVVPPLGIDVGRDTDGTGIYVPVTAEPARAMKVLVRAGPGTDPLSLLPDVRGVVASLDPDLALHGVDTLAGHVAATRLFETIFAALFLVFGLAGLLLATVGLYGLLAFTVRRRVRELGVRIALGAAPIQVVRTAVGGGLLQLAAGLAAGLLLAAMVAPLLGVALLGADPRDPVVYVSVASVLALTGLAAALAPARRALSVDVSEALNAG